jgi:hypothetical protein
MQFGKKYWPYIYLLIGGINWLHFSTLPPDGLANLGLILFILPLSLLDRTLVFLIYGNAGDFLFARLAHGIGLPRGYLFDHAYFYFPSLALFFLFCLLLQKAFSKK